MDNTKKQELYDKLNQLLPFLGGSSIYANSILRIEPIKVSGKLSEMENNFSFLYPFVKYENTYLHDLSSKQIYNTVEDPEIQDYNLTIQILDLDKIIELSQSQSESETRGNTPYLSEIPESGNCILTVESDLQIQSQMA